MVKENKNKPWNKNKIVGTKIVSGRKVDIIKIDTINKEIKPCSRMTSAYIYLPKEYQHYNAEVHVLSLMPFVCKNCLAVYQLEKDFSPNTKLCLECYTNKNKEVKNE